MLDENIEKLSTEESKKNVEKSSEEIIDKNPLSENTEEAIINESNTSDKSEESSGKAKDKDTNDDNIIVADLAKTPPTTTDDTETTVLKKEVEEALKESEESIEKLSSEESIENIGKTSEKIIDKNPLSENTEEVVNDDSTSDNSEESSNIAKDEGVKDKNLETPDLDKTTTTSIEDSKTTLVKEDGEEVLKESEVNKEVPKDEEIPEVTSQNVVNHPEKTVPVVDSNKMSLDEIVVALQHLISEYPINKIKTQFESLRTNFNKKYKVLISEKKEEFLKEGGNEIDFKFYLPIKSIFNDALREFKIKRQKYYKDIEVEQKLNLSKKLELIEELKGLIDTAEPSTMYKKFRALQEQWRSIGQIPHSKYSDVWRTYHHHAERFYDLLHLNNDLRDLDFKHNLEEKTKLIEKVEKLAEDSDINSAFKELQVIHRMWKEDIGPVGREVREEVWKRFSDATKKIHNRRHKFQNEVEANLKKNIALKLAVVDKIKEIKTEGYHSHKMWQEAIRDMESLRKEFFAIGRVPRSKNEEVWQIFKDATKSFNKSKNAFYKTIKKSQTENLEKKMQLVEQAESLKDSDDWESVTEVFKKIQSDWKTIGHVPRRDSDKIWKRFKDACNHYFERLHNMQDGNNKGQAEVFIKKKELLEKFKTDIENQDILDLNLIKKYMSDWKLLGVVPSNMRHIEAKFNKALDNACKKLDISKEETEFIKFRNLIDGLIEQKDVRKIDNEQLFIRRKVDELTKEIKQLENNISFISNATDDNPLVKNVYKNIERYNQDLSIWKKKLSYFRNLEY